MIDKPVARVLAAIEETERIARDTHAVYFLKPRRIPSTWAAEPIRGVVVTGRDHLVSRTEGGLIADAMSKEDATHIARHDPAAVLRRCVKDREIVDRYIDADSKCKRYMSIEKDVTLPIEERQRASTSRDMWGAVAGALFRVLLDLAEGYGITPEVTA